MAFGLSSITGMLGKASGMSSYKPTSIDIDPNAYLDPYGAAQRAQLAQGYGQYSGANQGFLGGQQQLVSQLQQQAQGQGPSLAQQQLAQAMQQAQAQNAGLMATQRGVNPGMALRMAGMNQAGMAQGIAAQGAQARIQEQLNAQQQLQTALGTGMQQTGALQQFYQQQQLAQNEADRQAQMQRQQLAVNQNFGIQGIQSQNYNSSAGRLGGFIGGLGSAAATVGGSLKGMFANGNTGETTMAGGEGGMAGVA